MTRTGLRGALVAALSLAVANTGIISAAQAGIAGTELAAQSARDADLAAIQAGLAREDVRAQLERFGVDRAAVEQRLAVLDDAEVAALAQRMQQAPAGGSVLAVVGLTFLVLLILELVGVIDIFKKV